ncbi:MAG: ribose transport system substrate-binding protein [Thermoanaerobacteraceae bacterium]|nr:ribose transport system substrate-binding protein [Thermoanaerobacteraceae bacterium]
MLKRVSILIIFLLILSIISTGCSKPQPNQQANEQKTEKTTQEKQLFVAQSMPTLNNPWYVLFAKGSKDMAEALGVKINQVTNPETSAWSPASQISKIEDLIAMQPDVIEIDPTSTDGINPAIDEARKKGIPVIVSGIHVSTDVEASITADNKQGGELCGDYMGKILNGKGKVAMLLGTPGRDIIQNRENGFRNGLKKYDGIEIVAEQVADLERAKAVSVTENILQAHPDIDAIWAANDEMALGAVEAVRARGLIGKVKIGGFDATPDAVEAIKKGEMHFTANQIPYEIGARAIAVSVMIAKGNKPSTNDIILPMNLITSENVNEYLSKQEEEQKNLIEKVKQEYGF